MTESCQWSKSYCRFRAVSDSLTSVTAVSAAVCSHYTTDVQMSASNQVSNVWKCLSHRASLWKRLTDYDSEIMWMLLIIWSLFALVWSFLHHHIAVPPSHSPVRLAGPEPGSAPRCSAGWPSPLPPEYPSAQTQTADAALRTECGQISKVT